MPSDPTPLARALGRIPTGLYVVSTLNGSGRPLGFLGSFLMQVGFEPPVLCLAIAKGRAHLDAVRVSRVLAVSVLDGESKGLMGGFFRPAPDGASPFDSLETKRAPSGAPVLSGSLAWLDLRYAGEHDAGDHVVVFGEATAGEILRDGDPAIHLRKNGLGY